MVSLLDEAATVLRDTQHPLHYRDLMDRIIARGIWKTTGKTPEQTLNAKLSIEIQTRGDDSVFVRTAPATYGLRNRERVTEPVPLGADNHGNDSLEDSSGGFETRPTSAMSFTNAASHILDQFADRKPMHFREVTEHALRLGLILTHGRTPEATLYSQIIQEIERAEKRGTEPRFIRHGQGLIGLSNWQQRGLTFQIEQHNKSIRSQLEQRLMEMDPSSFETLIGRLLVKIGFEQVEVTKRSGDGGIDVRGTLVVGDVIRTNMAVQVKRWKANIQSPVVQQVRGSLGTHDQGLIITTSDFSSGARQEAARANATPVALMNGNQLVDLLVENEIGIRRSPMHLLGIDATVLPED